ncbi:hypothetical protein EVAR_103439_1 [Eumeta japonica]|uniref:Uncharacterized protein n=1 Tax=Eumeta variegata TaxID=151549 RepID=A0A4C1Z0Z1_EUMVA|nr:hypothetical protein EVAR_103439_1 [Eumeta japonica]
MNREQEAILLWLAIIESGTEYHGNSSEDQSHDTDISSPHDGRGHQLLTVVVHGHQIATPLRYAPEPMSENSIAVPTCSLSTVNLRAFVPCVHSGLLHSLYAEPTPVPAPRYIRSEALHLGHLVFRGIISTTEVGEARSCGWSADQRNQKWAVKRSIRVRGRPLKTVAIVLDDDRRYVLSLAIIWDRRYNVLPEARRVRINLTLAKIPLTNSSVIGPVPVPSAWKISIFSGYPHCGSESGDRSRRASAPAVSRTRTALAQLPTAPNENVIELD